jgi:hypothetical protein
LKLRPERPPTEAFIDHSFHQAVADDSRGHVNASHALHRAARISIRVRGSADPKKTLRVLTVMLAEEY